MLCPTMPPIPKKAIKLSKHKFRTLTKEAYERDGYRCQICKGLSRVGLLTPHHIIPRGRLRLDILENLLTVCIFCHAMIIGKMIDKLIDKYKVRLAPWLEGE